MFGHTTQSLANLANVTPSTIRATLSRKGNFLGIKPAKLRNGRLLWPAEEVDKALRTFTFIQPWFSRKAGDIGEARAFIAAVATAMENQRDSLLACADSENEHARRDIRIELENLSLVIGRLNRGYAEEVASYALGGGLPHE